MPKKRFKDLSEKEILALAIQLEEEDARVYSDFAEGLRDTYSSTAKMFEDMQAEESRHRQSLIDLYQQRFGSQHYAPAESIEEKQAASGARKAEDTSQKRLFMLQIVQPGLAGLMDGSVSTLAPIFAAALATHKTWDAFLVGLAASLGAGISMAFAEALSDDGSLTGGGKPLLRGVVTGSMTTLGGLGHTLPFLISDFRMAFTAAVVVVIIELGIISFVRHRYMDMPIVSSAVQVIVGGGLVFAVGILIGSS